MKIATQKKPLLFTQLVVFPAVVFCLILIAAGQALAADGDYLRELESEAESSSSVSTGAQKDAVSTSEMATLEKLLQSEKPSTYRYYNKLSQKDKAQIVNYYNTDNSSQSDRLTHIQKKVLDLYFK